MGKWLYVKNKKTKPHELGHWSEKKKHEAVVTYLALGNLSETSKIINVPLPTLTKWKHADWWKELVDDIQSSENQRSDNKMSKVIDRALDILVERLEQGDYQYDQKTGKLVKVPLKARDLERISSGLFDKRQLLRKQPTNIKADSLNQADRLLQLAEQFAKFAGQKLPEEKVINEYIEGEYDPVVDDIIPEENTDALHEERKTGLQT